MCGHQVRDEPPIDHAQVIGVGKIDFEEVPAQGIPEFGVAAFVDNAGERDHGAAAGRPVPRQLARNISLEQFPIRGIRTKEPNVDSRLVGDEASRPPDRLVSLRKPASKLGSQLFR